MLIGLFGCCGFVHLTAHLEELEQLLKGIAVMKELTPRTRDYLVSFGECMSTRIFAAYLNNTGVKARQVRIFFFTCVFFVCQNAKLSILAVAHNVST